jgi:hypothetical protein
MVDEVYSRARLPRGITGFVSADQPPLPSTDRRPILGALYTAARALGQQVGAPTPPDPGRNYWEVALTGTDVDRIVLLVNDVHPLGAFASSGAHPPRFVDRPAFAPWFSDCLLVLPTADLERAVSPEDLKSLADVEREQIRYWGARTFGEIIFNTWD